MRRLCATFAVLFTMSVMTPAVTAAKTLGDSRCAAQPAWSLQWFTSGHEHTDVIPGGQSIGIRLQATGIMVVGYHLVHHGKQSMSPGEKAAIRIGDVIQTVNGQPVRGIDAVAQRIEAEGRAHRMLTLGILRKGHPITVTVGPSWDDESSMYRIGLYIRDSASGVGTLTFYIPQSHAYGALGHVIADVDTGEPIVGKGHIVRAAVTSIDRGESGQPGEVRGSFVDPSRTLGTIEQNTEFGVFGHLATAPPASLNAHPVPVARAQEVHIGAAKIFTVIHGQSVEAFDVSIVRVNRQDQAEVKGFVIRVTDARLLAATGGIVQGMSGSPVIQDGKLVGAVTHVFVSDPTQGYGVYAQWMVDKAQQSTGKEKIVQNF